MLILLIICDYSKNVAGSIAGPMDPRTLDNGARTPGKGVRIVWWPQSLEFLRVSIRV